MEAQATMTKNNSKEFLYASAVLLKLYKEKVISRKVYEIALKKCKARLSAG